MATIGKITLRNYRCFDWDNPAVIEFGSGFTAIVGPNNSGKSSALRAIYEMRNLWNNLLATVSSNNGFRCQSNFLGVTDVNELANDHNPGSFTVEIEIFDFEIPIQLNVKVATKLLLQYEMASQSFVCKKVVAIDLDELKKAYENDIISGTTLSPNPYRMHYPEGTIVDFTQLFAFGFDLNSSRYFPAFRNAINEGAGSYYDIPVGTALVSTWHQWKAGNAKAQKIAISSVENEIARLLGFRTLQINADHSGKTFDVIINDRPQKLYEVGAGVAQLIIVLAAALVQKPPYILIDEPELSLHPSLQLSFLSTLGTYVSKGLVFSTHSIGLARSSAERIYSVHKIKEGISCMHLLGDKVTNFPEWLGELSYSGRVELGCEGIILLEGPTEVLCFQELLRKVNKDHKFVLMSLGGSSLINAGIGQHLEELFRIIEASKIHVFIDSEKKSETEVLAEDRLSFLSECHSRGVNAVASERRATENYFEKNGIKKALGEEFQPLEPYQKLKESPKPWHKSNNWKIVRETAIEDILDTDLGKFIQAL